MSEEHDDRDDRNRDGEARKPEGGISDLIDRAVDWLSDLLAPAPVPVPVRVNPSPRPRSRSRRR